MEPSRRLFVAVEPPPSAVAHLGAVVDSLQVSRANEPGRSTRLAAKENWHVTLVFLGDVPVARTERVTGALERAVAAVPNPIQICFAGGGTFGRGRFAILWAGLGGDLPALRQLARGVRRELQRARIPFDSKGFRPHLTISRPGGRVAPDLIAADVTTLEEYAGPQWTVDAVHLFVSETVGTPTGPKPSYPKLGTYAL
jgi:2'-5' RNA ligase